jgi:hypothetical protein
MHIKEKVCEDTVRIKTIRYMIKWRAFVSMVKNLQSSEGEKFLDCFSEYWLLKRNSAPHQLHHLHSLRVTFKITTTLYSIVVTICATFYNIQKLCILPTQCIYVFRMVLTVNSDCFPKQP